MAKIAGCGLKDYLVYLASWSSIRETENSGGHGGPEAQDHKASRVRKGLKETTMQEPVRKPKGIGIGIGMLEEQ